MSVSHSTHTQQLQAHGEELTSRLNRIFKIERPKTVILVSQAKNFGRVVALSSQGSTQTQHYYLKRMFASPSSVRDMSSLMSAKYVV
jgi:hypothetical protein